MEDVKNRIGLERAICRALVEECAKVGLVPVTVWDGGSYEPQGVGRVAKLVPQRISVDEVCEVVFSVDESTVHFAPADDLTAWGRLGVFLVGGNGCDFISDFAAGSKNLDAAIEAVTARVNNMSVVL